MENGPFIDELPFRMLIFCSYLNLPEGTQINLYPVLEVVKQLQYFF